MCIPKINFLGDVFEVQYEKTEFCHFFQSKMVQNYAHGNLEIGHMLFFCIRIKFQPKWKLSPLLQDANNYIYTQLKHKILDKKNISMHQAELEEFYYI